MDEDRFDRLCAAVGVELEVADPVALRTTGASVAGEIVAMFHEDDIDLGVHVFIDVGVVSTAAAQADIHAALLSMNLALPADESLCFCMEEETGRILLRGFVNEAEASASGIAARIRGWTGWLSDLRSSELALVQRSRTSVRERGMHGVRA